MNKNINILSIITTGVLGIILLIIFFTYRNKIDKQKEEITILNEQIEKYKQAANPSKEIIDSLVYNIEYRDSIIYNIKHKYINDVEIIKNMSDSVAIDIFNKLVWAE